MRSWRDLKILIVTRLHLFSYFSYVHIYCCEKMKTEQILMKYYLKYLLKCITWEYPTVCKQSLVVLFWFTFLFNKGRVNTVLKIVAAQAAQFWSHSAQSYFPGIGDVNPSLHWCGWEQNHSEIHSRSRVALHWTCSENNRSTTTLNCFCCIERKLLLRVWDLEKIALETFLMTCSHYCSGVFPWY